jgi:hypothetical protein
MGNGEIAEALSRYYRHGIEIAGVRALREGRQHKMFSFTSIEK